MGDLSAHFASSEFACHHCGKVKVSPLLVTTLEKLRSRINRPISILSGYRCPYHNQRVGGATSSQHLVGQAADLRIGVATVEEAKASGFTGVGYRGQWAVHVDVRGGRYVQFRD